MNDFWKTKEGKILAHTIHEHSSAMCALGAFFVHLENNKYADCTNAKKSLKKAEDAIDYAYTKFKDLYKTNAFVEFLKWCDTPVYRANGELSFRLRVQPQFPDYQSYIIIDETGRSMLPTGKYLSIEEVYEYWINGKDN
jgi:hypothetical protein